MYKLKTIIKMADKAAKLTLNTQNVTSSWTLFYKFFLPTIWIVFFATLFLIFLFIPNLKIANLTPLQFRLVFGGFLLVGISLLYFTVMQLKRVEMDDKYIYVTNYFKIFKYPYFNVEKITIQDFLLFRTATVHFIEPGTFGKKATFIPNKKKLKNFLASHPEAQAKMS